MKVIGWRQTKQNINPVKLLKLKTIFLIKEFSFTFRTVEIQITYCCINDIGNSCIPNRPVLYKNLKL